VRYNEVIVRIVLLTLISLTLTAAELPRDLREGDGEQRAAKDALEGKLATAVVVSAWMNTSNGNAPDLKGKS